MRTATSSASQICGGEVPCKVRSKMLDRATFRHTCPVGASPGYDRISVSFPGFAYLPSDVFWYRIAPGMVCFPRAVEGKAFPPFGSELLKKGCEHAPPTSCAPIYLSGSAGSDTGSHRGQYPRGVPWDEAAEGTVSRMDRHERSIGHTIPGGHCQPRCQYGHSTWYY